MKITKDDEIEFKSGRREHVGNGIIGLGTDLKVYEGYDGELVFNWTPEERCELADYMIEQWTAFKTLED